MLSFIAAAFAHPSSVPHAHSISPVGVAFLLAWVALGLVYLRRAAT
jgi:hypothetical protein